MLRAACSFKSLRCKYYCISCNSRLTRISACVSVSGGGGPLSGCEKRILSVSTVAMAIGLDTESLITATTVVFSIARVSSGCRTRWIALYGNRLNHPQQ